MLSVFRTALIILTAAAMLSAAGCAARRSNYRDDFRGRDKLYHAAASAVIGGGATAAARNNGAGPGRAPIIGVSAAVAIGAGKEWFDLGVRDTFWSWKDLFWDVAGGAMGAYIVNAVE